MKYNTTYFSISNKKKKKKSSQRFGLYRPVVALYSDDQGVDVSVVLKI